MTPSQLGPRRPAGPPRVVATGNVPVRGRALIYGGSLALGAAAVALLVGCATTHPSGPHSSIHISHDHGRTWQLDAGPLPATLLGLWVDGAGTVLRSADRGASFKSRNVAWSLNSTNHSWSSRGLRFNAVWGCAENDLIVERAMSP
jgi:hypothetical protein